MRIKKVKYFFSLQTLSQFPSRSPFSLNLIFPHFLNITYLEYPLMPSFLQILPNPILANFVWILRALTTGRDWLNCPRERVGGKRKKLVYSDSRNELKFISNDFSQSCFLTTICTFWFHLFVFLNSINRTALELTVFLCIIMKYFYFWISFNDIV